MSRINFHIVLTEAEVVRFEQWIRAGFTPQQVVLRARIILAATGPEQDREIAARLKIHRRTVALWRRRARQQGIGCVWEIASQRPAEKRRKPMRAINATATNTNAIPHEAGPRKRRKRLGRDGLSRGNRMG